MAIVISSVNKNILDYLQGIKQKFPEKVFCLEIAGRKTVSHIIPYLNIFDFYISNLKEALQFGVELKSSSNIEDIMKKISERGPKSVVVTGGSKGIYYGFKDQYNRFTTKKIKAKKVKKIVSTIGAGDSVTASFCAAYYGFGLSIEKSLEIAKIIAALTIKQNRPFPRTIPPKILKYLNN